MHDTLNSQDIIIPEETCRILQSADGVKNHVSNGISLSLKYVNLGSTIRP